ncbi:MAG: 50S ribosomal protein L25, partial [Pseudomonadota bacterium]
AELICDLATAVLGDTIKISHISLPDGVVPVIDRDFVICNIEAPRAASTTDTEDEDDQETQESKEAQED